MRKENLRANGPDWKQWSDQRNVALIAKIWLNTSGSPGAMDGKGVRNMSRRIAVELYDEVINCDRSGITTYQQRIYKVVMTGGQ